MVDNSAATTIQARVVFIGEHIAKSCQGCIILLVNAHRDVGSQRQNIHEMIQ